MKTRPSHPLPAVLFAVSLLTATALNAATLFETNFSVSDGYSVGALADGSNDWAFTNGGTHSWYIAKSGTQTPKKPSTLDDHPAFLNGDNLFWIAARTENLSSTTNTARLSFAETAIQETFAVSFDLYVGPQQGTSGSSFNFALAQGTSLGTAPVRIWLHSGGTSANTVSLRFSSSGTSVASLAANGWYRFEFNIAPATTSSGTWEISVYSLDSAGSIVSTVYSSESSRSYSGPSNGFDTLTFQTVSNRSDYWIDSITVTTIPEPQTMALLSGVLALLAAFRFRR